MIIPFTPLNVIIVLGCCFGLGVFSVRLCGGFYIGKQKVGSVE